MEKETALVDKAMRLMQSNVFSSKSWLITARSLYPRNFQVQVSCYF